MFRNILVILAVFLVATLSAFDVYIRDLEGGLEVQMDVSSGVYGIGDTAGRAITYDFGTVGGLSHFVIVIDDTYYSNSSMMSGSYELSDYYLVEADARETFLYAKWEFPVEGDHIIQLEQLLTPMVIDGKGLCEIKYAVYNGDTLTHDVGLLINQDIILNHRDSAPIAAGGTYSGVGMFYAGMAVPFFWQAFENTPGFIGEQLIATGYLRGLSATKPDIFTFGNQMYLFDLLWDIDTTRYVGDPYFDTGMILRWETQGLNPDKDQMFVTYLGIGENNASGDSLLLFSLAPTSLTANCTDVRPNPFEVSLLVHNQSIPGGASGIEACILTLPEGISATFGEGHWPDSCHTLPDLAMGSTGATAWLFALDTLAVFPDEPVMLEFVITCDSYGRPIYDTVYIKIPSPSGIPPTVSTPFGKRFTSMEFDTIYYIPFYPEDDEGIDYTSMRGSSGPINISYFTEWWEEHRDTILLSAPLWLYDHADTVISTIRELKDINGCHADDLPVSDTIIFDWEAPFLTGTYPSYGRHVDSIPVITFFVDDQPAGFDPASIVIVADGRFYNGSDPEITCTDTTIVFTSPLVYELDDVFEITLLSVCDKIDLGAPNCIEEEYTLSFWVDPGAVDETPALPIVPGISSIKPNPANSSFSIDFNTVSAGVHMLNLYSLDGKKSLSKQINIGTPGRVQKTIDLGDFETGIYIVIIEGPGISDSSKLCVVK